MAAVHTHSVRILQRERPITQVCCTERGREKKGGREGRRDRDRQTDRGRQTERQ